MGVEGFLVRVELRCESSIDSCLAIVIDERRLVRTTIISFRLWYVCCGCIAILSKGCV